MAFRRDILKDKTILVVDDDRKSLHIAQIVLQHFGAKVFTAGNGEEGLERAHRFEPHIVLTDLSMPVLDGWQFLQRLREEPRWAEIPVIAFTAHAMTGDREKALEAGFSSYIAKPLTPANFMDNFLKILAKMEGGQDGQ